MILVLLGTQNNSFIRLLEKIDKLIQEKVIKEEVIVQAGYTKYKTQNMEVIDFVPKDKLVELVEKANYVITHGGVGSIISSLKIQKRVIAVPRLSKYQEHVNNHQKEIVELFDKKKYIIGIKDLELLEKAIQDIQKFIPQKYEMNNEKMLKIIEDFIG